MPECLPVATSTIYATAFALVCVGAGTTAVGCQRSASPDVTREGGASAKPATTPPPDAPAVTTVILEESRGADTLRLYDVITARGHLKPDVGALGVGGSGVRFGVSLLGNAGDTLHRQGFRSGLTADMDVANPDGTFRHVAVEHEVIPHVVRYAGPAPAVIAVTVRDERGVTTATQLLPVPGANRN